jgi:hypothetical protein
MLSKQAKRLLKISALHDTALWRRYITQVRAVDDRQHYAIERQFTS